MSVSVSAKWRADASSETASASRDAYCRRPKMRMRCSSRKTDSQQMSRSMNQPEATSPRRIRLSAVVAAESLAKRTNSAAQTKLESTDCRFLGLESETTVEAPALRLSCSYRNSTTKPRRWSKAFSRTRRRSECSSNVSKSSFARGIVMVARALGNALISRASVKRWSWTSAVCCREALVNPLQS